MANLLEEIIKIDNGAKFYRADLHIHTYGLNGSYDVNDDQMTPRTSSSNNSYA